MMTKALKGTLAAAAGVVLGLSGVAAAQAQGEEPAPSAASGIHLEADGVRLDGARGGNPQSPEATMRSLDLGDGDVRTVYCIQLGEPAMAGIPHEERPWDDVPVEDLPKVLGVLLNGYNGSNAEELIADAGVADQDLEDFTVDQVAYAGTQSAIWSLTDAWVLDGAEAGAGVDAAVKGIQDYLLANAEPVDEPDFEPYFDIDDSEAATEGATVGPFTVDTNFDSVAFAQPEGATIVDENGEAITSFADETVFFVKFDEVADSTVTLVTDTITWTTPAGRTFVPVDDAGEDVPGQRLILAEEFVSEYAAELEFEIAVEEVPSESPKPQLPVTGSSLTTVASVGGAVLLAGVVAMVLMRRRAAREDWGSNA